MTEVEFFLQPSYKRARFHVGLVYACLGGQCLELLWRLARLGVDVVQIRLKRHLRLSSRDASVTMRRNCVGLWVTDFWRLTVRVSGAGHNRNRKHAAVPPRPLDAEVRHTTPK